MKWKGGMQRLNPISPLCRFRHRYMPYNSILGVYSWHLFAAIVGGITGMLGTVLLQTNIWQMDELVWQMLTYGLLIELFTKVGRALIDAWRCSDHMGRYFVGEMADWLVWFVFLAIGIAFSLLLRNGSHNMVFSPWLEMMSNGVAVSVTLTEWAKATTNAIGPSKRQEFVSRIVIVWSAVRNGDPSELQSYDETD